MRIFSYLYRKVLNWSKHPHAPIYLAGVSFAESSFFPVPPDIMLISMTLANPHKVWRYALITVLSSLVGGMLGYLIGAFFIHLIYPWIVYLGYGLAYASVQQWFSGWGLWLILMAGFSPIPYKIFTIGAGAMHVAFLPFVLASLVGRTIRFFSVAAALRWTGPRIHFLMERHIDKIGWVALIFLIVAYLVYLFFHYFG